MEEKLKLKLQICDIYYYPNETEKILNLRLQQIINIYGNLHTNFIQQNNIHVNDFEKSNRDIIFSYFGMNCIDTIHKKNEIFEKITKVPKLLCTVYCYQEIDDVICENTITIPSMKWNLIPFSELEKEKESYFSFFSFSFFSFPFSSYFPSKINNFLRLKITPDFRYHFLIEKDLVIVNGDLFKFE